MILWLRSNDAALAGKPRASGDDPGFLIHAPFDGAVNPARAGMIPLEGAMNATTFSKPRASGDDPAAGTRALAALA